MATTVTFIIILLLFLLLAFYIFKIGDAFSPWAITVSVWLVMLIMLKTSGNLLFPISDQFIYCLIIWIPIMCFAGIITYKLLEWSKPQELENTNKEIYINEFIFNIFFVIDIVLTPLHFYAILKTVSSFDLTNILYNIRLYNIGGKGFGILNYSTLFSQVCLIIALWKYPNISKIKFSLIIIASILSALTIMGKTPFLFIILSLIFVFYEKGRIKLKTIIFFAIPLFLLFFIFTNARQSQDDTNNQLSLIDFLSMYILSPPIAFGYTTLNVNPQVGYSTFAQIYRFLNDWGLGNYEVNPGIQEFVFVPIPTNVYTIFQPFYEDFKYGGIAFFALVYGFFTGWIYYFCKFGGGVAKCLYAYILINLALQFFQENIFISFIAFAEFCILIFFAVQNKYKIIYDTK